MKKVILSIFFSISIACITYSQSSAALGEFAKELDFGAALYTATHDNIDALLEDVKKEYKGRMVILDLWGTFCKPCMNDFKNGKETKQKLREENVEMLYLCAGMSSTPAKWMEVIKDQELKGNHIYLDHKLARAFMQKFGIKRYPGYVVLTESGEFKSGLIYNFPSVNAKWLREKASK